MKLALQLLRLAGFSALSAACILAHRPGPLPQVPASRSSGKATDLTDSLKQAAIKGSGLVEVSQDEINRHLQRELQLGPSARAWLSASLPLVELQQQRLSLHFQWNLAGLRRTARIDLSVARRSQFFEIEVLGGALGRLRLSRGLLKPLQPALGQLHAALQPEIQALFQMNDIRIAQGKLVLDPHIP